MKARLKPIKAPALPKAMARLAKKVAREIDNSGLCQAHPATTDRCIARTKQERAGKAKACQAWSSTRFYGEPGPCQSKRGIERVGSGYYCVVHRSVIEQGGKVRVAA